MAMTLVLLEKFIVSEVENLHSRIDELIIMFDNLERRMGAVERQVSVLVLAVENIQDETASLRSDVNYLKQNMVTKTELYNVIESAFKKYLPGKTS